MRATALALLLAAAPAAAQDMAAARAAAEAGEDVRAVEILRPLAEAGGAEALVSLGRFVAAGAGTPKDEAGARRLHAAAGEAGAPENDYDLAFMYLNG